ncbi:MULTISPECIES: PorP/SprF family type IX secretion system membrane protein [Flavobacteriaceae]|uniref:PorP/SprF family type IX secretion system membrane protein n=1 Tax=Flavobacteriaceae TaxID=49546 RepID=UPI00234A5A49|nr:type IX secretion system membrane protein PorP/SprF [Muricauda sp. SP22]MDC6363597.1 type IX secretion system membrane protein PorP/SprF [Muricauda sp. SP22]
MKIHTKNLGILTCLILVLQLTKTQAQQSPQYTQYMYNTTVLNPGYTGTAGNFEANVLYRSQWVGLDGAPETQSFTVQGRTGKRVGLGLTAINDNIGASNNVKVNGHFAYEIPVGQETKLSLGLNAGLDILSIDWSKGIYADDQDPVFAENLNKTRPIFGVGAFLYGSNWYLGASSDNIMNSQIYNDDELTVTDRKTQYYFMGGYVVDVSSAIKFKPAFLTKHVSGAPLTLDVSANFLFQEKVNIGLAYRYDDAISALAGFHLAKKFFIGYAYDYSITGLDNYNDGSHEIILKYTVFDASKRALSPRFF